MGYQKTANLQEMLAIINSKKGGDNLQIITLKAAEKADVKYAVVLGCATKNEDGKYSAVLGFIDKEKPKAKYEAFDIDITGKNKGIVLEQVRKIADVYPPVEKDVQFLDMTED